MYLRTWLNACLLSLFLTSGTAAPASSSSPSDLDIGSLLGLNLVQHINVFITLQTLVDNLVTVNFDLKNTLLVPIPLVISEISTKAGVNNTVFATFSHTFNPALVANPGQTVNSGNITNVNLTQGALNTLGIIPGGVLDINSNVVILDLVPVDGLTQNNVPTTFTLDLSD